MLNLFKEEKIIYKLKTLAVLATAVFFVFRIIYAGILALPYPKEILEPANVALTNTFLDGYSPYTLASLERRIPGVNYDYPFMNSLVAAAIAKIMGCGAVTAHFVISLLSILGSGVIGYAVTAKCAKTTVAPVLTGLMFMFCHWRFGYISAAPDDLGLLLYLLTIYAASSDRVRNKPVWCAVGITLCFYTKQYFIFAAVPVFIYMLLYSVKEAIRLFLYTIAINAAAAVIITMEWPLYWMKTIAFTYLGAGIGGGFRFSTFLEQLDYLVFSFAALFAIVVVAAFMGIRKLRRSNIRLKSLRVRENDPFAMSVVAAVVMIVPLSIIGRNDGALISYFLQLWMPEVSLVAAICMERMIPVSKEKERIYVIVYAAAIAVTLYFGFGRLPLHILTAEETANWQKAYAYTKEYSEDGDVFYSRSLAYDGFARGNGEWYCGHEGEVSENTVSVFTDAGIPTEYFPYMQPLVDQNLEYRQGIVNKAQNHEYSLITADSFDFNILSEEFCEQNGYRLIDRLDLQLGNMPYEVVFYAR